MNGYANVTFSPNTAETALETIHVSYNQYTDDGLNTIEGNEELTALYLNVTLIHVDWTSSLVSTGASQSTKMTSPGGFHFEVDVEKKQILRKWNLHNHL